MEMLEQEFKAHLCPGLNLMNHYHLWGVGGGGSELDNQLNGLDPSFPAQHMVQKNNLLCFIVQTLTAVFHQDVQSECRSKQAVMETHAHPHDNIAVL